MMAEITRLRSERRIAWNSLLECWMMFLKTAYQAYGDLPLRGVEDEPVPVHGYQEDGEGGEEDAGGLDAAIQLADQLLQNNQ